MFMARIKHLMIYPVKSCAGIELTEADLQKSGLSLGWLRDRELAFVRRTSDDYRRLLTQRDKRDDKDRTQGLADLTNIKPRFIRGVLQLSWNGEDPINIFPFSFNRRAIMYAQHGDDRFDVVLNENSDVYEWASDHLGLQVYLVRTANDVIRSTTYRIAKQNYEPNDNCIQLQDGYPVHWISEESIRELSDIVEEEIDWKSFRPNIVVEGMSPQYEHKIYSGEIVGIPFVNSKPCDRCPITKVNQVTGEVDKKGKILKALSTYKNWFNKDNEKKVIFGENMLPLKSGQIDVFGGLIVTAERNPPLVYGSMEDIKKK